jgi:hypothetical protein
MNKKYFTKIFLKLRNEEVFPNANLFHDYLKLWWKNKRKKAVGGLRLSDEGFEVIKQIELETYTILFPKNFKITTQVLIQLDQFIDCPYYLTENSITVTSERKAVELTLFSGDVKLYGNAKASRKLRDEIDHNE